MDHMRTSSEESIADISGDSDHDSLVEEVLAEDGENSLVPGKEVSGLHGYANIDKLRSLCHHNFVIYA